MKMFLFVNYENNIKRHKVKTNKKNELLMNASDNQHIYIL